MIIKRDIKKAILEESSVNYEPGAYTASIVNAEMADSTSGTEYLNITLECTRKGLPKPLLVPYVSFFPHSAAEYCQGKLNNFLIAFDIPELDTENPGLIVGKKGVVVLQKAEYYNRKEKKLGTILQPVEHSAFFAMDKRHPDEIKDDKPAKRIEKSIEFAMENTAPLKEYQVKQMEADKDVGPAVNHIGPMMEEEIQKSDGFTNANDPEMPF